MYEKEYDIIKDRYGFSIPEPYRILADNNFFPVEKCPLPPESNDLWLSDMEWHTLKGIAEYEFQDYHLPGFVPFAFTCCGDQWCWQPEFTTDRGTRVVLCYHDCEMASIYAPDLSTALFRNILEASCIDSCFIDQQNLKEAITIFKRWAKDLSCIFPERWCKIIQNISDMDFILCESRLFIRHQDGGFITKETLDEIIAKEINYSEMNKEFRWMKPYDKNDYIDNDIYW